MATVHLICGLPCSGKSTYSKSLKADTGGVHFTLDYWLITCYGPYDIEEAGYETHVRRVVACRTLIWDTAKEFLDRNVDVILDDGFFFREHRIQYVKMAEAYRAETKIHYMEASKDVIRTRLEKRNKALPEFNFHIDPGRIEDFFRSFEVPSPEEGTDINVVHQEKG
jgi:predicted kinase